MDIFTEAQQIRGFKVMSIKAMGLYAESKMDARGKMDKGVRQEIQAAWDGANPVAYARAVRMKPDWFQPDYDVSEPELWSLIKIGGVNNRNDRFEVFEWWQKGTRSYDDVRAKVDERKVKRERKPRKCPKCGEVIP